jgi:signal transduction histidine kinase/CheY-like chemotaxis protein
LAKADFWAVVKAIRIHQRLDRLFPPQRRIVSGAPWFLRYFPALWWQSRQGKIAFLNSQAEISRWILQQHIQLTPKEGFWQRRRKIRHTSLESSTNSLMEFISEMQWDEPGSTPNPYDPEHPFHAIANALQVVKSDFDDLWTERDRRERDLEAARFRAEEAQRLQSAFLANVSHEIRTPLNAVIGMGDLLSSTQLDNQQADLLQTLRQSAQGLLTVINDILDLSRMQAGEFRLVNASFDLPALLDDVSRMIGYLATTKGLDFALIRSPELPPIVTGDAVRLRQILVNLAGNAVKFTEHGRVRVRANVSSHEGSLWHLQIDIEDTGPGIPEDKINDLFQPFRQLDDALSRKFGGTGLGLAIARNLSERMGGEITVKSVIQKGSVFTLALPLEESHSVVLTETSVFAIPNMPLTGHVLVAEDNRVNQKVIHGLLTRMGVEATLVNDGLQAIQALKAHPGEFACVLMDIQMPVMDGLEAVKRIRAGEAGYDEMRIPVIALTAHAMEGDHELFLKAGMDEYLSKPIKAQNLRAALAPLLLRASQ